MKPASRSPSYLVNTHYGYCFRMNVPKDLERFVGRKEFRYTLKTGSVRIAKEKARYLAAQFQQLFRYLRKGGTVLSKLEYDQIKDIVEQYIKNSLKRLDSRFYERQYNNYSPPYTDRQELYAYINGLDAIRDDLIVNLNLGDFSMLDKAIDSFLKENGIDNVDKDTKAYRKLCAEVHKAEIKLIPIEKRHMQGDFSYRNELPDVFPEIFPRAESSHTNSEGSDPAHEKQSEPIEQVYEAFWKENISPGNPSWKPRTVVEYKSCGERLLSFLGQDTQIHKVGYQTARDYKASLMQQENKDGRKLSTDRINLYLGFARQFFNYAKRNNFSEVNPFEGLQISQKKKRIDELRDVFDLEDLKKVFCESDEYSNDAHRKAENFWVPILGLYTGCRLEEICQLYISDVVEVDGIWCLDINDNREDKSVKTDEKRIVPLHPLIVEDLNFIGYVKSLSDQQGRVFPELKRISHRYGHYLGKWFASFKNRCGITAARGQKVFHSFRHTLINHLKQDDVPERYIAEFVGHSNPSITTGRYGKRYEPKRLYENVVMKLDYGVDLSHLRSSRFVLKDDSSQ